METLKGNDEFKQQLGELVKDFEEKLKDSGFDLQLAKLTFQPVTDANECPCGFEFFIDPQTGEIKSRCRRCPK